LSDFNSKSPSCLPTEGARLHPETEGETDTDNSEDWRAPFICSGAHTETRAEEPGKSVTANNREMTETAERAGKTTEHSCSICKKIFRSKHHLKIHTRVHTGEKPCSCPVCGKRFAVGFTLKLHMRTHTGDRPFSCSLCEKTFSQNKQNLKVHTRVHTGEKPYSCSVCGKAFVITSKLKIHMRTHTGEKPYSCSFCEKMFSQKGHLHEHIRIHTGDRPYRCSLCGKTFIQRPHLKVTHVDMKLLRLCGTVQQELDFRGRQ
uniref:C2H2-type domain-containing protein n=1 Tax=Periophthalmus magnuspinnatus TaxID=409849 RepID=A0A3B4ABF4_9GOBI